MALILKGGAVFLHVPKTGGNWITEVLRKSGLVERTVGHKHATMDRLLAMPGSLVGNSGKLTGLFGRSKSIGTKPYMFCFVRHPLAWYESWFNYMSQPARDRRQWGDAHDLRDWHPCCGINECSAADFDGFIRNVIKYSPGFVSELYADVAKPQIDFIGRQESLRDDLVTVLRALKLEFDEDFVREYHEVGVSPRPMNRIEWDPELRREIMRFEEVAIARYGYNHEVARGDFDSSVHHEAK